MATHMSRRARTVLAMDQLLMDSDGDPRRITRQDIAARAADWTIDPIGIFVDDDQAEPEHEDYYEILNSLAHIVHHLREGS